MDLSDNLSQSSPRMPFLVLEFLLEYLDFFTLTALRLVCKTTKEWVETPELLCNFVVRITGKARLDEVLLASDPLPWSSFAFTKKSECLASSDIQRFLAAYGDKVLHLDFLWNWETLAQQALENAWCLMSGCPHLESLQGDAVRFELRIPDEVTYPILPSLFHMTHLKNLQHFNMQDISCDSMKPHEKMVIFSKVLSTCTQLKTLSVPNFMEFRHVFQKYVVTPLLDAIAQGQLRSVSLPEEGFDDKIILQLANACREAGTVLYANRFGEEPWRTFLKNLPLKHPSVLDIIGNLNFVTDSIIRQQLTNVRRIHLSCKDFGIENSAYSMPPFLHLREVKLDFNSSTDPLIRRNDADLELFVKRLVAVTRATVKSLSMSFHNPQLISHVQISPVELCTSFVNLRVLHVREWKGRDEEWLKLWPLVGNTLVELELIHCPYLSDLGILGDDLNQPAFLQLKHLRKMKLSIRNVGPGKGKITELSFIQVFRHMRLRSFHFWEGTPGTSPGCFSAQTVEAMLNGPFGESIEEYKLQVVKMPKEDPSNEKPEMKADEERNAESDCIGQHNRQENRLAHDDQAESYNTCCCIT